MKLGHIELSLINDGMFRLDGGTMFGMVPKALWNRVCPADPENLVELRTGVLLIREGDTHTLVDAGMGQKLSGKLRAIYRFDRSLLMDELAAIGLAAGDIHRVILTHLHLDHAGGCTRVGEDGRVTPAFPDAEYVVQVSELAAARNGHPLTRGSYIADDFEPMQATGQMRLVDGDAQVSDAITLQRVGAHTAGLQIVRMKSAGVCAVFPGDLIPTAYHLNPAWTMSYDNYPLEIGERRMALLEQALEADERLVLQHDAKVAVGRLKRREGSRSIDLEPME